VVAAVAALTLVALVPATVAGAQDGPAVGSQETTEAVTPALPVSIGRPGAAPVSGGWAETGLAVPVLLALTAFMLLAGAAVLAQRCLQHGRVAATVDRR